jgi:hypothetical protein
MAVFGKFYNASLVVNSVDLSARVKSVTLNYAANMLDASAMSDGTQVNLAGLLNWNMSVEFNQDYAAPGASAVDSTLFPLIGAAAFTVTLKPDSGAVSATNPRFYGSAVLASYNPASGAHGSLHSASASFSCAGALTRSTT